MPIRKHILTDGITSEAQIIISAPLDKADVLTLAQEHSRLNTFDGRIADLERACKHLRGDELQPAFGSRAWYAQKIQLAIGYVRDALARGDVQLALSEAVEVGDLATEAKAKFSSWRGLLLREARATKNRELSGRGAKASRDSAQERLDDEIVITHARAHFEKHPTHSMRSMAANIAGLLDAKSATILDRLRKRGIRKRDLLKT